MTEPTAAQADARQLVTFPEPMRLHTITSMRDHLLALQEIDVALSKNGLDKATAIAEQRPGMSSLELHGSAHIVPFMPQCRQDIGNQMHRSASRFAVEAQNASVGNDVRPALATLGTVMQECVACHAAYPLHCRNPTIATSTPQCPVGGTTARRIASRSSLPASVLRK